MAPVNLDTASHDELMTIPGIGTVIADKIVEDRIIGPITSWKAFNNLTKFTFEKTLALHTSKVMVSSIRIFKNMDWDPNVELDVKLIKYKDIEHFEERRNNHLHRIMSNLRDKLENDITENKQEISKMAPVNLDSASMDELMKIQGIGPAMAEELLDEREFGPITSWTFFNQLTNIKFETTLELHKSNIVVSSIKIFQKIDWDPQNDLDVKLIMYKDLEHFEVRRNQKLFALLDRIRGQGKRCYGQQKRATNDMKMKMERVADKGIQTTSHALNENFPDPVLQQQGLPSEAKDALQQQGPSSQVVEMFENSPPILEGTKVHNMFYSERFQDDRVDTENIGREAITGSIHETESNCCNEEIVTYLECHHMPDSMDREEPRVEDDRSPPISSIFSNSLNKGPLVHRTQTCSKDPSNSLRRESIDSIDYTSSVDFNKHHGEDDWHGCSDGFLADQTKEPQGCLKEKEPQGCLMDAGTLRLEKTDKRDSETQKKLISRVCRKIPREELVQLITSLIDAALNACITLPRGARLRLNSLFNMPKQYDKSQKKIKANPHAPHPTTDKKRTSGIKTDGRPISKDCPESPVRSTKYETCLTCGGNHYHAEDCPNKRMRTPIPLRCFTCAGIGHIARECVGSDFPHRNTSYGSAPVHRGRPNRSFPPADGGSDSPNWRAASGPLGGDRRTSRKDFEDKKPFLNRWRDNSGSSQIICAPAAGNFLE